MEPLRIQKFIRDHFSVSRRQAEELILQGKVLLNDQVVTELGTTMVPQKDTVKILESSVKKVESRATSVVLYKPEGYVCTKSDPHVKKSETIMALLPEKLQHLNPVGRLDKESSGLIICTNDGNFANQLSHPRFSCEKEYLVEVAGRPAENDIQRFARGFSIDDIKYAPCQIHHILQKEKSTVYSVILQEGKNRQIRRMFEYLHHPVLRLKRIRIHKLTIASLKKGAWKFLSREDMACFLAHQHG